MTDSCKHTQRKRIFLNLDGTGQSEYTLKALEKSDGSLTSHPVTNVVRIGRATLPDDIKGDFQQIVYYQAGVGASSEDSWLAQKYQGATGAGLLQNVREAYGFLCNNYDDGDEIFITGFSRGAFTARSVAGMIGKVGILTKKGMESFYEAFDFYERPERWSPNTKKECPVSIENGKTRGLSTNPFNPDKNVCTIRIKAVGVFDTVGALRGNWAFHDVELGDHIDHAFHILALDETRRLFAPTLWESPNKSRKLTNFEQCWMPGDHSNVGGSWPDQQLADLSLAWMMSRYEALGVKFNEDYLWDEFKKFKDYVKYESKYKEGSPTNPRQWGEGRCESMNDSFWRRWVNTVIRKPMMYRKPWEHYKAPPPNPAAWFSNPWPKAWWNVKAWFKYLVLRKTTTFLQNTNETIHASVRHRYWNDTHETLGPKDRGPYSPKALAGWLPSKEANKMHNKAPVEYSKDISDKETRTVRESELGRHEEILLDLYNNDPDLAQDREKIWAQVLGDKLPKEFEPCSCDRCSKLPMA